MKKKIKKYFVNADDSTVLAMSVVEAPAVESNFVYFSKQQKIDKFVALESNDKHMIFGCALRPDFPIYRNDGDEEYYLEFSKEAVEKLSRDFMINGFQKNFTEAHKKEVEGITITESWIKVDMEKDKSIALGVDPNLPIGSWIIGGYVNNNEIWEKVKDGSYKGFSVEAIVDVNELNFEEQTPEPKEEPIQEPTVEQTQEPSKDKSILDKILELINGRPIEDVAKEAPKTTEPETEPIKEEPKEDVKEEPKETTTEQKNEVIPNPLDEVVKNLRQEIETLKKSNSDLQSKLNEIGKQPSVNPTSTSPKGKNEGGVEGSQFRAWRKQVAEAMG